FSGPSSLLYHRFMPEAAHDVSAGLDDISAPEREQTHTHAHLRAGQLAAHGDVVSGRRWLLINDDVRIGMAAPEHAQEALYVNGSADEGLFFHEGSGTLHSQFGRVTVRRGDYVVIPRGVIHRFDFDDTAA